jgi:hypothetical protein
MRQIRRMALKHGKRDFGDRGTALAVLTMILLWTAPLPAEARRPFLSATDAPVVEPGDVEVELGFGASRNTRGDTDETSYDLPSVNFTIGIVDWLEIGIGTGFGLVDDQGADLTLGSIADTALGFKTLWGDDGAPSIGAEVAFRLPTARAEFQPEGNRLVGGIGRLILSGETDPLVYMVNLGGGMEQSPADAGYVGVFIWAVAGELTVVQGVAVVTEFQGTVFPDADDDTTALLGLTYTTLGGVKFDVAGFAGLTAGAENWGITFGVTYAIPVLK